MTEEEKVETPTTEEEEKEPEVEAEETDESEESVDTESSDNSSDYYEAELEKERKRAEAAETKLAETRKRAKERFEKKRTEPVIESEENLEDKPLTRAEMEVLLSQRDEDTRKSLRLSQAESLAGKLAGSDAEKNLIIAKWQRMSFSDSIPLSEQIQEAYGAANAKKLVAERNEALRALKGRDGINTNAATSHESGALKAGEPKMAADVKGVLVGSGFTFNQTSRRYEKKVKGGIIVKDPKTGKTSLEPNRR